MTRPELFHELHRSGCFVMPNPWDRGTAVFLERLGFKALATTSAGLGFSLGKVDEVGVITLEQTLDNVRDIVEATTLPVNADFQDGFSPDLEDLARNVTRCVETGVAGLSIEDASGDPELPLYEHQRSVERVRAARAAIDRTGIPVLLTARCEAWLVGDTTPFETALQRLVDYAEAGADCLFAPGVRQLDQIQALVQAVRPKPLNVLVSSPGPDLTLPKLAEVGVRRISVGSALARVAWGAFMQAARELAEEDSFEGLARAVSFDEINSYFPGRVTFSQPLRRSYESSSPSSILEKP